MTINHKNKKFSLIRSKNYLIENIEHLPDEDECYKFISYGSFSSASFIAFVSEKTKIKNLYVSTFRIGKKEIQLLNMIHNQDKLDNCTFMVFSLMKESDDYNYYKILKLICNKNSWNIIEKKNHSKVLLFDTDNGKYVIETSSNLNENPKIEQFSFEKDDELYNFYLENLFS